MKGSQYKILHDFQSSKDLALGTDYSYDYVKDNGIMLYLYNDADENDIISLSFKTFLESFSISFDVQYDGGEEAEANVGQPKDFSINYDIKLKIPSISLNDARVNASRLEELNALISPRYIDFDSELVPINTSHNTRVLLANLIHNGSYKEQHLINTPALIKKYGLRCFIEQIDFSGDVEQGYFEAYNRLFFKSYDLNLKLQVFLQIDEQINDKKYVVGFSDSGYLPDDIKTWPFGVL